MNNLNALKQKLSFLIVYLRFSLKFKIHFFKCFFYEMINPDYVKKVEKKDVEPVFIIGAGRSGNTLLSKSLHENSGICFGPENYTLCQTYYTYLKNINRDWEDRVEKVLQVLFEQEEVWRWKQINKVQLKKKLLSSSEHTLGNIIHCWYISYLESVDYPTKFWGCKTPNLTPFSLLFIKIFPNSRFIYTIRNYKDVIQSYFKSGILLETKLNYVVALLLHRYNLLLQLEKKIKRFAVVDYETFASEFDESIKVINRFFYFEGTKKVIFNNPDTSYAHLNTVNEIIKKRSYEKYSHDLSSYNFIKIKYSLINRKSIL